MRLCSDTCHRLIPPDMLIGLTTDGAVLEIKSPFVLFRLTAFQDLLSEGKLSHRLGGSSVGPQKPSNISHICYATYPTSPCPLVLYECATKTMVRGVWALGNMLIVINGHYVRYCSIVGWCQQSVLSDFNLAVFNYLRWGLIRYVTLICQCDDFQYKSAATFEDIMQSRLSIITSSL